MKPERKNDRARGQWRCLTFSATGPSLEILAAVLHENGSIGAEEREGQLHAYFVEPVDEAALVAAARAALGPGGDDLALESSSVVDDGRWHERWVETLAPIEAGRGFLIVPGKAPTRDDPSRTRIVMLPGRAFGTGEHATTRMCVNLLEDCIESGDELLDVGTGSGILAIVARLLGASSVLAIDIDPVAVGIAAANARANQVGGVDFAACGLEALRPRAADVVVANLYGATLVRLMAGISRRAARDVVLSGFDRHEEALVSEAAGAHGLRVESRLEEGGWISVLFRRRTDGS